jgi:DNA helicase MCM9
MVGDPGTGKSQFLRFASKLMPRAVLTTGIGSTTAGLTCTAVKDGADWALEAGALVLADRGICCIDEFGTIRAHDRTAIHEAMEQQSISVAKAGMVVKLKTRCSVLAATNPKGRYDWNEDVSVNTAIASPLLSRFDVVLVLLDNLNPQWDEVVSSFILQQAASTGSTAGENVQLSAGPSIVEVPLDAAEWSRTEDGLRVEDTTPQSTWSLSRMQAYLAHIRDTYTPQVSQPAQDILSSYYQLQRSSESRSAARTTIRMLESLVRLSQAHARLRCSTVVDALDALQAVCLVDLSGGMMGGGDVRSAAQTQFPHDPDAHFALQAAAMLQKLSLAHYESLLQVH